MPQGVRICKVCGREYPYCKTNRPVGISRWQDVCCSPEHAAIYFAKIAESRAQSTASVDVKEDSVVAFEYVEDSEEEDAFFEEEFDDDTEEPEIEL